MTYYHLKVWYLMIEVSDPRDWKTRLRVGLDSQVAFENLNLWLHVGDPLAEDVVAELRSHPGALATPLPTIRRLAAADNAACRRFLESTYAVPAWADFDAMSVGAAMAARYYPHFAFTHSHSALFLTFAAADPARILGRTGRFDRSIPRRIAESETLFFRVVETEELRPGGEVWEIALRVRLMHAVVRQKLIRSGEWNLSESVPINALHTSAGPLLFGTFVLEGLRALGARPTAVEAEAYRLIWRYVTWVLGVPEALLGGTDAEQRALDDAIATTSFDPDDESRRLARACLQGFRLISPLKILPESLHAALTARLLGSERAARMGIVARPWARGAAASIAALLSVYAWCERVPFVARRGEAFGRRQLRAVVERNLAGVPADYKN